jgi:cell division protein FtsA
MPVRLGLPQYVKGLSEVVRNPIYATGVGLLIYGLMNGRENSRIRSGEEGLWARIKRWMSQF